jgi:MYXO-CTERM domain-containing protein
VWLAHWIYGSYARTLSLAQEPGTQVPVAIADAATWIIVDPATDIAQVTGPSSAVHVAAWPHGIVAIEFTSALAGQVETSVGTCTGTKQAGTFACTQERRMLRTDDGGRTWTADAPFDDDEPASGGGCGVGAGAGLLVVAGLCRVRRRRRS